MKKNYLYMQTVVMDELMTVYTSHDIAEAVMHELNHKDEMVSIYETHADGFEYRKKRDSNVSDETIINAMVDAIRHMIKSNDDLNSRLNDSYDFDFDNKCINSSYLTDLVKIRRSGRIISIEIDIQ